MRFGERLKDRLDEWMGCILFVSVLLMLESICDAHHRIDDLEDAVHGA